MNRCLTLLWLVVIFLGACNTAKQEKENLTNSTKEKYLATSIKYAKGFSIELGKDSTYKILSLFNPFTDEKDTLQYLLLPKDAAIPQQHQKLPIIRIPVQKMVVLSTTHIGFLEALESIDVVKGMSGTSYLYSPEVKQKVADQKIISLNDQELDIEAIVALEADLVMVSGMPQNSFGKYQKLIDLGVPVLINSEWLENTPLGKAEWLKMVATLLNKERVADKVFTAIEKSYNDLKNKVKDIENRKTVFGGMAYQGTWHVAGGNSFMANFIADAGASYPWSDAKQTGSMPLAFEEIYAKVKEADIWLNAGSVKSLQEVAQQDERYKDFKAFKTQQVFNRTKRVNTEGGNDYWESGVVKPHLILADLIKILYPEKLPEHQLYYYEKLN